MASLADLKRYLSGGGGNSNPALSLGGAISSTQILNQLFTRATSLITGVTITDAFGNATGTGTLSYTASSHTLTWTPPSGTSGTAIDVSVSGTYAIQGGGTGGGCLSVTVVSGSLPGGNVSDNVTISALANALWSDVTKPQSAAGIIQYRCEYIKNTHSTDSMFSTYLWIASNCVGQDTVSIGLDPAGVSGTATTIANETTVPAGVTFSSPTASSPLSIGTLAAGAYQGVWVRRTVPLGVNVATPVDGYQLGVSAMV